MAGPYSTAVSNGGGSASTVGTYSGAVPATTAPATKSSGGFLGLGGALNKAEGAARGVLAGGVTIGKAVYDDLEGNPKPLTNVETAVARNEAKNWGDFAMTGKPNVGVGLDALSLATGGAGLFAKAGDAMRAAGVATDLGKATDLTAPDFAVRAGQMGEKVVIKQSSGNPLVKAVQVGVNKGLNKLPDSVTVKGRQVLVPGSSESRIVKALAKDPQRAGARVTIAGHASTDSFSKLSAPERAALHLKAQGVTPAEYKALLLKQETPASPKMLKLLDNPKVAQLVKSPTPRLANALAEGRAASEKLTSLKLDAGHINETAAAERPYQLLRLVNGAEIKPVLADGFEPLLAQTEPHGFELVDKPGRDIPTLAQELADKGEEQPFYVPHSAETTSIRDRFTNRPATGFSAPAASGAAKQNLGILASKGTLAFNRNPLDAEFAKFKGFTEAQNLHDAIVRHAAELPDGAPLPHNYQFLKINRGEATAPYLQRVGGEFEHGLEPSFASRTFTTSARDPEILTNAEGKRLVVPTSVKRLLENRQASASHSALGLAYQEATSVWKHMILGLRPATFTNITGGNSILGALQASPRYGFTSWLNQVAPKLEGVLGKRVSAETMNEVFPEQALGTLGHTSGFGSVTGSSKLTRGASRAYQGVMPATIAYENVLRRAMVEGWARSMPEVKEAMKAHGGDINGVLRDVAKSHPQVINNISKRVDDALGDYRNYSKLERNIKNLVPFYGWDRHIARSTARLLRDHPARLDALAKVGQLGQQTNQGQFGALPTYMQGGVGLPGLPKFMGPLDGRTPMLIAPSLNPFSTDADIANLATGLVSGQAGVNGNALASDFNPIVQAIIEQITGRSLLTGAALPKNGPARGVLGNTIASMAGGLPQVMIAKDLLHPPETKPTALYRKDIETALAQLLGIPVKKVNLQTAHLYASEEGKPNRG